MSTSRSKGMSSGARHGLGAVIGLVLTPVIGWLLMFGMDRWTGATRMLERAESDRWVGMAVIVLAAVLLGVLMGSRLSPLASLVPGVLLTLAGLPWLIREGWSVRVQREILPERTYMLYAAVGSLGIWIFIGCMLLAASVPPSRWRAAAAGSPRQPQHAPQPGGQWPPPHQVPDQGPAQPPAGAAGPPPFDPNARPYSPPSPRPALGEPVPGQIGQPGPAAPQQPSPASPAQAGPPAQGPGGSPGAAGSYGDDDDEPGEWTRMYGGKGSRDDRPQS
jgi:hypothetical protein